MPDGTFKCFYSGTLTYEDVTNIDSIGIVTARNGLQVTNGSVGIGTDNDFDAKLDNNQDGQTQTY